MEERSIESVVRYALSMPNGQTISFPYSYQNQLETIRKIIRKKTSLNSFKFKIEDGRLTIGRYQLFNKDRNLPKCTEVVLWQSSKMMPSEISTFCIEIPDGRKKEEIVEHIKDELMEVWDKEFNVSIDDENGDSRLVIICNGNSETFR